MCRITNRSLMMALTIGLAALIFVACGNDDNSLAAGTTADLVATSEVQVTLNDNAFNPTTVTAPSGEAVQVNVVNEGSNVHEVEIKGLIPETKLQPGETKSFTITPEKKTYRMYCEIHEDLGMEGEFIGE